MDLYPALVKLSIKVIGSRSRSCAKNEYLLISTCYFIVCDRSLLRSRLHIKDKVNLRSFLWRDAFMRVVCIWIKWVLVAYRCFWFYTNFTLRFMRIILVKLSILGNSLPCIFLKKVLGGHMSFFGRHWHPCFGFLATSSLGFKVGPA